MGLLVVILVSTFFITAGLAPLILYGHKKTDSWARIANIGTYFQGCAAILALIIAIVKGDEILNRIETLAHRLDGVREGVDSIQRDIKRIPIPKPPKVDNLITVERTELLKKYWTNNLSAIPDKPTPGEPIYLPNKDELIRQFSNEKGDLRDQLERVITLKRSIKINETEKRPNEEIGVDIISDRKSGGYFINVNSSQIHQL